MDRLAQFLQRHPMSRYDPGKPAPSIRWLIDGLWLGGGKINGLFGTPKSGKSRLLGWSLVSLLNREPFMPEFQLGEKSPELVLYVHAEEDEGSIVERLRGYARVLGTTDQGWSERLIFMPGMGMGLNDPAQRIAFDKVLERVQPDLLVIDPYVRVHGAKENDATAMARMHNDFRRWTQDHSLDVILVHHTAKLDIFVNLDTDISRWARGTSDIAAMLDSGVFVHRMRSDEVKIYRVGRFRPRPPIELIDRGDEYRWKAKVRNE